MIEIINLIISYWYYFAPILLIALMMLYLLIKRGYIKEINVFGIKIEANPLSGRTPETQKKVENSSALGKQEQINAQDFSLIDNTADIKNPLYSDESLFKGFDSLINYTKTFTPLAIEQISALGLTQDRVIELIQREFLGHLTYFRYDILNYPLPLQNQYIVVLDKIERSITVRAIKAANFTELELASWSSVLGLYRRATRYKYRTENNYVLKPEVINLIHRNHIEIIKHILRHLSQYNKEFSLKDRFTANGRKFGIGETISDFINYCQGTLYLHELEGHLTLDNSFMGNIFSSSKERWNFSNNYEFVINNIALSLLALNTLDRLEADIENQIISEKVGHSEIVLALELSLQYLHKIILSIM